MTIQRGRLTVPPKLERPVPASRIGRLALMGKMAGGIAGSAAREGVLKLIQGERPSLAPLLLTPDNAQRLASRLSEMRGAAMKVGQLLSMDGGQFLPPELGQVLARLRDDAHQMPMLQVAETLTRAWGKGWEARFERFSFTPIAAASIGQVHQAILRDGRRVAIKVQYPGVRRSIDSDVNNVMTLLRLFKLTPEGLEISRVIEEAKAQLHREADYLVEAAMITEYAQCLGGDERFAVTVPDMELTTREVLAMRYLEGAPIESVADLSPATRDTIGFALLELSLRELFDWGLVQTDPNFANYQYDSNNGRVQLLDFGATRAYSPDQRARLRALLCACIEGQAAAIIKAAIEVGYLRAKDSPVYRDSILALLRMATEPLRIERPYTFGATDLARRMRDLLIEMRLQNRMYQLPPPEILFLHRKLGGIYLLLTRLKATVPVRQLALRYAACRR